MQEQFYLPSHAVVLFIGVAPFTVVAGLIPSDVVHLTSAESRRISILMIVVRLRFIAATPFTDGLGINGSCRHFVCRRSRLRKSH